METKSKIKTITMNSGATMMLSKEEEQNTGMTTSSNTSGAEMGTTRSKEEIFGSIQKSKEMTITMKSRWDKATNSQRLSEEMAMTRSKDQKILPKYTATKMKSLMGMPAMMKSTVVTMRRPRPSTVALVMIQ